MPQAASHPSGLKVLAGSWCSSYSLPSTAHSQGMQSMGGGGEQTPRHSKLDPPLCSASPWQPGTAELSGRAHAAFDYSRCWSLGVRAPRSPGTPPLLVSARPCITMATRGLLLRHPGRARGRGSRDVTNPRCGKGNKGEGGGDAESAGRGHFFFWV